MASSPISAAEGFAIAMLAMMALSLGIIGALLLAMRRNAARRDRQIDELLEEVEEMEKLENPVTPAPRKATTRKPWERDGDWWRN